MNRIVGQIKRAMDVAGSLVGLAAFAPLFPLAALLIKIEDGGPIFYEQERALGYMGSDGSPHSVDTFRMLKFRTMLQNAEGTAGRPVRAKVGDSRVTRIGRFLRNTRLDEVPQLVNVLLGHMSLVGPRPERPLIIQELAAAIPFYEERMRLVKPGLTGLAQIKLDYMGHMDESSDLAHLRKTLINPFDLEYSGTTEADDVRTKILFDFAYAASMEKVSSFLVTDLEIMFKTPLVMIAGKGR